MAVRWVGSDPLKRISFVGAKSTLGPVERCAMGMIVRVVIWLFGALVVTGAAAFVVLDAMDKVESIQKRVPWVSRILERRSAFVALLLICAVLLVGDGYELFTKEVPEIPVTPNINFPSPSGPRITTTQRSPTVKDQCWVKNYGVPVIPSPPAWVSTIIFCNTTIKPPYTIEYDYDQSVTVGPLAVAIGSEFMKSREENRGAKIFAWVDLHTIIPNEPLVTMASNPGSKVPLVKTVIIRAKGRVFEFHP